MAASPQRILYYCQSLVGVGHLACSLRIIGALLEHFEVDLIQGGLDGVPGIDHPRYRNLRQRALLHDEVSGEFFDPEGTHGVEQIWALRRAQIEGFLRWPYHAVVLEFYPFGRRRFKPEIIDLLQRVQARCGPVPVFCSVREVLVPRAPDKERRMVASVHKHIHTVFVRSDPQLLRLHETFSLAHEIEDRLCHTGYIGPPPLAQRPPRRQQILVSQGGGNVGRELLEAAIGVAPLLPAYRFLLAAGSTTPAAELDALRRSVRSVNVEIVPFLADFPRRLAESALSINMGGDNTLLEVLNARTPALAYPYQDNPEQGIRIAGFARKGLVHALTPADLAPARLKARIAAALAAPYPEHEVALDGAAVTCDEIRRVLATAA